jgi:hypothetical protein
MKIDFCVDYDKDLQFVFARLTRLDPSVPEKRMKRFGNDFEVIKNILSAPNEEEKLALLDKFLKKFYEINSENLEKIRLEYQEIWKDKADTFFSIVTELMGSRKWKYDNYIFIIGSFYSRAQWGKGNVLATYWNREPHKYWHMNGYELILSHVFEIVDQIYEERPISNNHIWALAESIAYILIYREEKLKNTLWPSLEEIRGTSYPQLTKHLEYLTNSYKKSTNFDDFLKESVEYIKNFTENELTKPT